MPEETRIHNQQKAKQLIDFAGLNIEGNIYPTDIDGLIEIKDSEYIIFEVKYGDARLPHGQKLAIQRMVDDFTRVGKSAIALVCQHNVGDYNKNIIAAECKVREIYYGKECKWREPTGEITVKDAVETFHQFSKDNS